MIGIYAIFRKSDDKCVYVGQSKRLEFRINEHVKGLKNSHLSLLPNTCYGIILEKFDSFDSEVQLNREAYWINKLNPELNRVRNRHDDAETLLRKKDRCGIKNSFYCKTHSDKTKELLRIKNTGKNNPMYGTRFKWMTNGKNNKRVNPDDLNYYKSLGWREGMTK
jgi:hypothetical protein